MAREWRWITTLVLMAVVSGREGAASLLSYLERPEPQYRWEKVAEKSQGDVTLTDLRLRSQVWRDIPWDHTIRLYRPSVLKTPRTALMLITGGNPDAEEDFLGVRMASRIGGPVAILFNIPNQPLFDGLKEDDLIAHTCVEYLKSGDATWPLLFPMVKSAVKAMDAVQAFSQEQWGQKVEGFVLTGASKRGWTTYLTGAMDGRVRGIAPMVFDNLNIAAQMAHQRALWGTYSEQIAEYTNRGLQEQLGSERGRQLVGMLDPWHYREKLKMPKLLIHASNDRYWATDAVRLYWDGLPDEKWVLSVPNAGHSIKDLSRVFPAMSAFYRHVAAKQPLPKLTVVQTIEEGKARLRLSSRKRPKAARLWVARSETHDLRAARWEETPMRPDGSAYVAEIPVPTRGAVAWFGEAEYEINGETFTLSTPTALAPEPKATATPASPSGR